ncbi:hypothetical protein CUN63_10935 [Pseudomonas sp. ACM7]|nr:hypothetical protein CUN63_10935 [Pseudomonas sp. ACM7]
MLAKAIDHSTLMSTDTPPSRASPLPHLISSDHEKTFAHKKAPPSRQRFYQSVVFSSYPSITSHNASSSASLNKPAG